MPYSETYGDVYHSAAGGAAQARHVFLAGNGLPGRWRGRRLFTILETGFGLGTNFLATLEAWRADPQRCERLHFVSIEKHPLQASDLAPELRAVWPLLVPGMHRVEFDGGRVVLTLFFADISQLKELRLAADALYLDGFAPEKNPEMWSPQTLRALSRLCARGATAATWSVAAPLRRALEITGFEWEKREGFGGKREMLVSKIKGGKELPSKNDRTATVIGAGLAGAAICERLCARGWKVTLHERHAAPAQEASGNHAGAFHPVVTPDDSVFARLTRAGFLYALTQWRKYGNLRWDACGVLQLSRNEKEGLSQQRGAAGWPADYAQWVDREEASRHAGVPVAAGGLWFPRGGWIRPQSLVKEQLEACGDRLKMVFGKEVSSLRNESIVILANSADAPRLHPVPHLRLRRVRGQLTYVPEELIEPPHAVVLRGGMVLPPVDGLCVVGATYDLEDEDSSLRQESHKSNLERLKQIIPVEAEMQDPGGRVAFRSVTPDRLPVAGQLDERIYGAFAFGSRGLVWAALAAELIASQLEGEPLPLEAKLADALAPQRFARRMIRRKGGKA